MKLSISNIAWFEQDDCKIYKLMQEYGFTGLEIAPTRIISENPYDEPDKAVAWKKELSDEYGFETPSMQSIWFKRTEKIFGSKEERDSLIEYTKKAINWAEKVGIKNLVFGCPRNRALEEDSDKSIGVSFFKELGDYAARHNCIIGMEANPPIYNTNYINDTVSALELIREVDSEGFKLNLDVGTMIHQNEDVSLLEGNVDMISHVHISEPGLAKIEKRELHSRLLRLLEDNDYKGFISIEMGNSCGVDEVCNAMKYVAGLTV